MLFTHDTDTVDHETLRNSFSIATWYPNSQYRKNAIESVWAFYNYLMAASDNSCGINYSESIQSYHWTVKWCAKFNMFKRGFSLTLRHPPHFLMIGEVNSHKIRKFILVKNLNVKIIQLRFWKIKYLLFKFSFYNKVIVIRKTIGCQSC